MTVCCLKCPSLWYLVTPQWVTNRLTREADGCFMDILSLTHRNQLVKGALLSSLFSFYE